VQAGGVQDESEIEQQKKHTNMFLYTSVGSTNRAKLCRGNNKNKIKMTKPNQ